ncbi:uncharacterized protein TNCV_2217661 [Trichonephila clavipes]|nr:uncharacterized protein TNCV_2217661 [Trichonephila clavipes]
MKLLWFNKIITEKRIESGLWALHVPRQFLNIANIQSRSWSGTEFAQVANHLWNLRKRTLTSIQKGTSGAFLMLLYFRGFKSLSEMQIRRFNKTAPSHKTKKTQKRCRANFPDMISSEEWTPYSSDLYPMECSVWVCTKPHKTLNLLKQSLRWEWDRLKVKDLRPIVENFCNDIKMIDLNI